MPMTTFSGPQFVRELVSRALAASFLQPEEVLVADSRGSLTPAQMVDRKLLALLGSCARSLQPVNGDPRRYVQGLGHSSSASR